jgi:DNA-binding transcriptional LysR family regulator
MSLVARGRGIGLVPERLLAKSPSKRRLCTLRIRSLDFPFTIWMITGELVPSLERPLDTLAGLLGERLSGFRHS